MKRKPGNRSQAFPRQAVLLAAGLGTRLRPLTHRIPKPALPVGGIPIILYNLYLLKNAGVKKVVINLHHQPAALKKLLKNAGRLGLKLEWSLEKNILGTAGGIAKALQKLKPEPTFILNGDILMDLDLTGMHRLFADCDAEAVLAVVPPNRASVKNFVEFGSDKKICRIAGLPRRNTRTLLFKGIFAGAHLIQPNLFRSVARNQFSCVIADVYQKALEQDLAFFAFPHGGPWWDLGDLKSLKQVDRDLWNETAPQSIAQLRKKVQAWAEPIL